MKEYINALNKAQAQAVLETDGPILILAGAGSGKTRTLTYKIAHLISKGIDPFNILALTFTNKAAKEMKERVELLLGSSEARNVWLGTFHSIFARILRVEAERLGYTRNFTIYDTEDSKRLLKSIVKNFGLCDKIYKASTVLGRISSAKSNLLSASDYINNAELIENDKALQRPEMGRIFATYADKCFRASAMDFDDLLLNMNILLRDFPEILSKYQRIFKYILVDEYQDTNFAQYMIIKKLAANNENISVVGDDAQSIYGFRGANIENILNLKRDYPDLKTIKLEQNYRSTQTIVEAANSVIYKNKNQLFKKIWTANSDGELIDVVSSSSDNQEGQKIAETVLKIIEEERCTHNDIAILYRTNAQSRSIEEALRKRNIPYRIFGGISFYQRKEIKDLIAYFRIVLNHNDDDALLRIINYPMRGIGKTTLDKIIIEADVQKTTIWQIVTHLSQTNIDINSGALKKVEEFVNMIKSMAVLNKTKNAFQMAEYIAKESGILKDLYEDKSVEGVARLENIEELINGIKSFTEDIEEASNDIEIKTLSAYIQDVALLTDADKDAHEKDVVSLMTIHSAKGLEFPFVFIAGVEENLFPSVMSLNSRSELEEERRLFYVAITRAMKKLFIHYAESRYKWGDISFCEPSRFIDEIDAKYINYNNSPEKEVYKPQKKIFETKAHRNPFNKSNIPTPKISSPQNLPSRFKKVTPTNKQTSQTDNLDYEVGMVVTHERFGQGKIISIEGASDNKKAIVLFDSDGQKQLLLKYAKLKIIS